MKGKNLNIVVFGLSLSSSWGNGHATTYRALLKSLAARGHRILFLERDVPWYAPHRDLSDPPYCELAFYEHDRDLEKYASTVRGADAVIVGSYVPQGVKVLDWVLRTANGKVAFYDIDTPVTLEAIAQNTCTYLKRSQIPQLDLYLSFTGGPTLQILKKKWGAKNPHALYCSVDPDAYKPIKIARRWALGYLGTYSVDRQPAVNRFIIDCAIRAPDRRFVVAGAQYPNSIAWPRNVDRIDHIPPNRHAEFYSSLEWALNLTRSDMCKAGYSPSVRLFEAAACGTPLISDDWPGLASLFEPDKDIVVATETESVLSALEMAPGLRRRIGRSGRKRVLRSHTSTHRAVELEAWLTSSDLTPEAQSLRWKGEKRYERLSAS